MKRPSLTVVKLGGSLFDWPQFPRRFGAFLPTLDADGSSERLILIAGGGPAADVIRVLDELHRLGDEIAHRLALQAMELSAHILSALVPRAVAVRDLDGLRSVWSAGSIPILPPSLVWDEIESSGKDVLPMSWDTSSDSIAARIAVHLAADRFILLKSAPLPDGTDRHQAAGLGLVDPLFPIVARSLARVEYVNLREHAATLQPLPP
jgi:5-(aminomethyl)-3-furanmethanol phosphate kinase